MDMNRREILRSGGKASLLAVALGAGLLKPGFAFAAAWNQAAFSATDFAGAIKGLGAGEPTESAEISFIAPEIAENGAVVPISITSKLPNTQSISVIVEKNPNPLTAYFELPEGTEPTVMTRVKMGQTSNVYALVKAGDKLYMSKKEVKVTLGGCGG